MRTIAFSILLAAAVAGPGVAQQPPAAKPAAVTDTVRAAPAERVGGARARVVIEEYADFQCPYCATHELQFGDAIKRWIGAQNGAVRLDFYDVMLRQHAAAGPAAHAARCAGQQGRYAAAKHALFAAQKEWSGAFDAAARVAAVARGTIPDAAAFDRCMAADATALYGILAANMARGRAMGIPGTPTFVITAGGKTAQVVDPVSPDSLQKVIRSLEKKR